MKLTLNQIKAKVASSYSFEKLLKSKGKTKADDELFDLIDVLESIGIMDTVWCLGCLDYRDYCLFLADVAESALHIYEEFKDIKAPRLAIEAIRKYHSGEISKEELAKASRTAADAASSAYAYAYASAYAVDVSVFASDAARSATSAVYAYAYAAAAAGRERGWQEIEKLFVKHFGNVNLSDAIKRRV